MKSKIVVDSSSDLLDDYIKDSDVLFKVCPLSVVIGDEEYIDDETIDVKSMLQAMHDYKGKTSSSCPSVGSFYDAFLEGDNIYVVTLSKKLSGSYNSALKARDMILEEYPEKKIVVFDSKSVCGTMANIVDEIYRLIKEEKSFDEIKSSIEKFIPQRKLFFIIQSFENFIKNGRVNRILGMLASLLALKPICADDGDGEIKITTKIRGTKHAIKKMVEMIKEYAPDLSERTLVISHCQGEEIAQETLEYVNELCVFKEVKVRPMRGLCSYYALEKGLILSF